MLCISRRQLLLRCMIRTLPLESRSPAEPISLKSRFHTTSIIDSLAFCAVSRCPISVTQNRLHSNIAVHPSYKPTSRRKTPPNMAAALEEVRSSLLSPTDTKDATSRRSSRIVLKRLSSWSANREDLFAGPAVVAPPKHLDVPSEAHGTAHAMELAKHHLAGGSPDLSPTTTPDDSNGSTATATPEEGGIKTTDKFAFAFDIDGVLIKGGDVIPEAIEAMRVLNGHNEYNIKV